MKSIVLSAMIAAFATTAVADSTRALAPVTPPAASSSGNSEGALVLLLVVGAVILMNGGLGSSRAKAPEAETADDDVLMSF